MPRYRVRRSTSVAKDFDRIDDFLTKTYQDFGDDPSTAVARAAARIAEALSYMRGFETHPHRGTERPDIRPGIRTVTHNRFIFYFEIDEPNGEVRILAVYFGGMDHQSRSRGRFHH